ncbi:MAG: PEGA domain-containing protein [Candidatus Aminicenantales bacterium]
MRRKNLALLLFLTLASLLLSPGCATLTRKSTQRIPVTSSPVGAAVSVNGVKKGVTPLAIRLMRKDKNQVIRIEYPGYNPREIQARRSPSPIVAASGLLGGIAGYMFVRDLYMKDNEAVDLLTLLLVIVPAAAIAPIMFDLATGAAYTVRPPYDLNVTLTKADGTPRVDTMLIDAEDFRNVKWIRIHRN